MENLMEMEYVINGEKYLITVTKVEESKEANDTEAANLEIPDTDTSDFVEFVEVEDNGLIQLPVSLVPAGMELSTWLNIIKEHGIILTD